MLKSSSETPTAWNRVRKALAAGGLGSWQLRPGDNGELWLDLSDDFLALTGLDSPDAPLTLNEYTSRYFPPEDAAAARDQVRRTLAGEQADFVFEHRLRVGPDRQIWLRAFGEAEPPESGAGPAPGLFGFVQAVDEPHRLREELAAARAEAAALRTEKEAAAEHLDTVINAAKIGVWDWDLVNDHVLLSPVFADLLGLPPEEVRGTADEWYELMHPDERDEVSAIVERALAGPDSIYTMTYRLRHRDGRYVWFYETGRVLSRDPATGRATRLVGVHFDFTDRKRLEEQQFKALATIAEQKAELEEAVDARTRLMEEAHRKMRTLLDRSGRPPQARPGVAGDGPEGFAGDLNQAFTFLANQMSWYKAVLDSLPFPVAVADPAGNWAYLNQPAAAVHGGRPVAEYVGRPLDAEPADYYDSEVRISGPFGDTTRFTRHRQTTGQTYHGQNSVLRDEEGRDIGRIETLRDITDIREADERTQIMLDALPLACNFWDESFRNIDCNLAAAKLFDLPDKQAYLDHFFELSPEFQPGGRRSADLAVERITRAFNEGACIFEWMHQKLDGTPVPCEISLIRVDRKGGHIVVGYTRDLRELKRTQAERDEADERTRIMLDALPLACNFWDENFRNVDCNLAAARLFDLPDKQAYLDRFFELSPEYQPGGRPSAELAMEYITKAFNEGACIFEWMHQKLDGTPVPCEISLIRVDRLRGHIVVGYTRDLRELKRTQAERDTERRLLRKIMDSTPVCFTITVGGVIKFITPFAQNFTGRRVDDQLADIYRDQAALEEVRAELRTQGYVNWRPVEILRADGQPRAMLLNSFATDYYGEAGVMSWLMDVTELKEARDAAEESTRAKSEFLANMSHEIRTPMNAILGLVHLVLQTEMTDLQREYLQKTEGAAKTLLRIINDILDFSKIEAGKLEMEKAEFHLADVLQNVTDLVSARAHEKGLEFLLRVPANTPAGLVGDQLRLSQVLNNLVSNAVKFTERGHVTLSVDTVEESSGQVTLRFQVEDTGIGLTPDQVKNLFSAFSQAEASTTRRYGGTGLGLAISKRLVELMGGGIWCRSVPGRGSTFGFTAVFGLHANKKAYVPKRKDFGGLSALAVDDNLVALEILSDFLRTLGFTVVTASSGQEALDIMADWKTRERHFDLVFIDWKMPDMDGIETSNRIHQLIAPAKLPVIIMATAYNRDDVLDQARQSGVMNVMTKPLSPSTLLNVLVDLFGRGLPEKSSKLKKAHEMALVKEFAGARILLAEDNEVNQLVASRILKNAELIVEVANNGREAVDMILSRPYDLVLMDIQMPEMDGLEATREIRSHPEYQDLPIVAMTAHAMSGDRELSLAAGMNDHVNKPINLQELFSSLAKWLRRKPDYR